MPYLVSKRGGWCGCGCIHIGVGQKKELGSGSVREGGKDGRKEGGKERRMEGRKEGRTEGRNCLLYTSPSPRDGLLSRMPSSA